MPAETPLIGAQPDLRGDARAKPGAYRDQAEATAMRGGWKMEGPRPIGRESTGPGASGREGSASGSAVTNGQAQSSTVGVGVAVGEAGAAGCPEQEAPLQGSGAVGRPGSRTSTPPSSSRATCRWNSPSATT
jgi:hypothetical protein